MRAFVTGSTGLLGSNLVHLLVEQGHEVTALVRSLPKGQAVLGHLAASAGSRPDGSRPAGSRPVVRLVTGDVRDVAGFAPALEGVDAVFHAAAYFREYYAPGDHDARLQDTNVRATLDLLATAAQRGAGRFVFVSSSGAGGRTADGSPADETIRPEPRRMRNAYFRSKWEAEQAIAGRSVARDLPVVTVRPGWMFGPRDAAPTASGRIVLDLLQRRLPALFSGGGSVVDARDVAAALLKAALRGRPGACYIVGGRLATLEEIARTTAAVSGVPAPRLRLPYGAMLGVARFAETWSRLTGRPTVLSVEGVRTLAGEGALDSGTAAREMGVTFRPLEETLRDEVHWFRHSPQSPFRLPAPLVPTPPVSDPVSDPVSPAPGRAA